jgi:threonine/homoserine/homoserine lactone efflux protein
MSISGSFGLLVLLLSLAVIPGPSDLLVAGSAIKRGYRSAISATLGILVADLVFILVVVSGARIWLEYFSHYQDWFTWVSSGVLVAFGLWMLRAKISPADINSVTDAKRGFSFAAGFTITFFDPKALAFYFGVLPAFFDIESFGVGEVLFLILLVSAVICVTKAFYAWIAVSGTKLLPSPKAQTFLLKTIGVALILTGGWRLLS